MQDLVDLDDLDLTIVNALQVNARASWTLIGEVLGVDPVTASRRWQAMARSRTAWVTAYSNMTFRSPALAITEIESGSRSAAVADLLAADRETVAVCVTSGTRDLLVTVTAADVESMAGYVLDRLGQLENTRTIRTHMVGRVLKTGDSWRLQRITADQADYLAGAIGYQDGAEGPTPGFSDDELAVLRCLAQDGRMAIICIAAATGLTPRRAGLLVNRLIASRRVSLRVDLQRSASGWPVSAWLFLSVPANTLGAVSEQIKHVPEIRLVLQVTGPGNLIIEAQLRTLGHVARLEAIIEERLAGVRIIDRAIELRTVKMGGVILDSSGRHLRTVGTIPQT